MKYEISRPALCVVVRGGMQLWIPEEKLSAFDAQFQAARSDGGLMRYEGERINPADVVGVFKASTMDEATRRKNGQWQCQRGGWHDRGEKCFCLPKNKKEWNDKIAAAVNACGKCNVGWVNGERGMRRCECCAGYFAPDGINYANGVETSPE